MTRMSFVPVVAAVLLLSACSPPIDLAGGGSETCVPSSLYDHVVSGYAFDNETAGPVTITGLIYVGLRGATVDNAWMAPVDTDGADTIGYGVEPLDEVADNHARWDERVDAVGAVVHPANESMLVVELTATEDEAALTAVTVEYSVAGRLYQTTSPTSVIFAAGGDDACTREPVVE